MDYDVVVIGAGTTGLAVSYELCKKGYKILLIEKEKEVGGLLNCVPVGNSFVEVFYHHMFESDKHLIKKLEELKIKDKLEWKTASTAFLFEDGIYEMSSPLDILTFKPLNWIEKIKFIFFMLKIKFSSPEELDEVSAKDWIISKVGEEIYKKMFEPILKSKFGERMNEVSAAWFVERIKLRSNRGLSGEKLGYIKGSFKLLLDRLVEEIKRTGGEIALNTTIEKISVKNNRVTSIKINGKDITCKYLVSTIPLQFLADFNIFDKNFSKKLKNIEYQGSLCILVGMKKKLTEYYWINIQKNTAIGAIIEHTNFQPLKLYKNHLLYLASYPDRNSLIWNMSDDEIWKIYFSDLKKLFPKLKNSDVKWYKVFKGYNAGIIYKKGFKRHLLSYETPIKNLFIAGLFNMYPERSINLSMKFGEEVAEIIDKHNH